MRKDTLGTDERPHYYSKFWIEVALGQAGIAPQHTATETAEPEDEFDEFEEPEPEIELPKPAPKPAAKPKAEKKPEAPRPVLTSLADLANIDKLMQDSAAMDASEVPDIEGGAIEDFAPFTTTAEPADEYAEQAQEAPANEEEDDLGDFYDEDEEEDEWGGGGAGRRPKRPQQRPPKRERRPY